LIENGSFEWFWHKNDFGIVELVDLIKAMFLAWLQFVKRGFILPRYFRACFKVYGCSSPKINLQILNLMFHWLPHWHINGFTNIYNHYLERLEYVCNLFPTTWHCKPLVDVAMILCQFQHENQLIAYLCIDSSISYTRAYPNLLTSFKTQTC